MPRPMFINATTRQQISIYSIGPTDICFLVPPHLEKWGTKKIFLVAPLANPILYPHFQIRGAAHALPHYFHQWLIQQPVLPYKSWWCRYLSWTVRSIAQKNIYSKVGVYTDEPVVWWSDALAIVDVIYAKISRLALTDNLLYIIRN